MQGCKALRACDTVLDFIFPYLASMHRFGIASPVPSGELLPPILQSPGILVGSAQHRTWEY